MANIVVRQERTPTRWNSLREMSEPERRFRGALSDLLNWSVLPSIWTGKDGFWAPSIELVDKGDKFIARAELPGMKTQDIQVTIGEEGLTITGERKQDKDLKEKDYIYEEHSYGSFRRVIPLPGEVDTDKVEASYSDGILEVLMPKSHETRGKKVEIKTRAEK